MYRSTAAVGEITREFMASFTAIALIALGIWLLLHAKTSRPDGQLIKNLHQYRTMMGYIMPSRNESVVYFEVYIDSEELEKYVAEAQKLFPCDITHCCIAGAITTMATHPTMNRFSLGHRLYQRDGVFITFSMKRAKLEAKAKLATVKTQFQPGETFRELCERIDAKINVERSGSKTYQDKEFNLLTALPRPLLKGGVKALKTLDYFNLLPGSFIANDPLYTSMFVANLGSLGMEAGYHHLYEWGNCGGFMMAGTIETRQVFENGQFVPKRQLQVRYTYDERMDDGLSARYAIETVTNVLKDPYKHLGCLREDGSDTVALSSTGA
jgi:hypothetical protein